jgi:3-hydroxyacyl-CoA dehydrogenase
MYYADAIGVEKVLDRINEFRVALGEDNWTPAPLLEKLAREKSTIAEWVRANAD